MSATVGAALKKVAVSFLLDKRSWDKIVCFILAIGILVFAPAGGAAAMFSQTEFDLDTSQLATTLVSNLTPEDQAELQFIEDTGQEIHAAMMAAGFTDGQAKAAEVLFVLALTDYAHEPGFVDKLVGCFAENQTDEQLIAAVNAAFSTELSAEEFTAIMALQIIRRCSQEQLAAFPSSLLEKAVMQHDVMIPLLLAESGINGDGCFADLARFCAQGNWEAVLRNLVNDGMKISRENYSALLACIQHKFTETGKMLLDKGMDFEGFQSWAEQNGQDMTGSETFAELQSYWSESHEQEQTGGMDMA